MWQSKCLGPCALFCLQRSTSWHFSKYWIDTIWLSVQLCSFVVYEPIILQEPGCRYLKKPWCPSVHGVLQNEPWELYVYSLFPWFCVLGWVTSLFLGLGCFICKKARAGFSYLQGSVQLNYLVIQGLCVCTHSSVLKLCIQPSFMRGSSSIKTEK